MFFWLLPRRRKEKWTRLFSSLSLSISRIISSAWVAYCFDTRISLNNKARQQCEQKKKKVYLHPFCNSIRGANAFLFLPRGQKKRKKRKKSHGSLTVGITSPNEYAQWRECNCEFGQWSRRENIPCRTVKKTKHIGRNFVALKRERSKTTTTTTSSSPAIDFADKWHTMQSCLF